MTPKYRAALASLTVCASLLGCKSEKRELKPFNIPLLVQSSTEVTRKEFCPNPPHWKSNSQISEVMKEAVQKHFRDDVLEMYDVFGIRSRELPPVKFVVRNGLTLENCQGAVYDHRTDDVTFKVGCIDSFTELVDSYNSDCVTPKQVVSETRALGRHEAAHNYFFDLAKSMEARHWFKESEDITKGQYVIHHLVSEGVAEYMAIYGQQNYQKYPFPIHHFTDARFPVFFRGNVVTGIYSAGLHLVTPILQKDFHQGIKTLIEHPVTEEDLYNLPAYRQKILKVMKK